MARTRRSTPVKLFVGLLSGDPDLLRRTRQLLARSYGPVEQESPLQPFEHTVYYEPEMGPALQRCFVSFKPLVPPEDLAAIKHAAIALEEQIVHDTLSPLLRPVNIDPGYITLNKVVLATTKDANHRIFIGRGMFAESTLQFVDGAWRGWPWTYADYLEPTSLEFFAEARSRFRTQRQALLAERGAEP